MGNFISWYSEIMNISGHFLESPIFIIDGIYIVAMFNRRWISLLYLISIFLSIHG